MDNVCIERLRRSLIHEQVYREGYADRWEARAGISEWMTFYNHLSPIKVWRGVHRWLSGGPVWA